MNKLSIPHIFTKRDPDIDDMKSELDALNKSQATIQFSPTGMILAANENFLNTVGYSLNEIVGNHHSMFVEQGYENNPEYKQFWQSLARGEYQVAEYKRIRKDGSEIWLQASYNPVVDKNGSVVKVIKYATDITDQVKKNAEQNGQIAAISKSQAVIAFELDGTIIDANENFLNTLGYSLDEIQGKHHSIFVEQSYGESSDYKQFWQSLARGEYQAGVYKRIAKNGEEIWIEASYNPIMDPDGNPFKVVKYATDITERKVAADINFRITQATQGAKANIMLSDKDYNIVYMNDTMVAMLRNAQSDIKKALPNFDANNLLGENIDIFHKNPAHQRGLLEALVDTFETSIVIGVRTFNLIANPILEENGDRIGTSVEWEDMTDKLKAKKEADELSAANARIKEALDKCSTNVMMADVDHNIIYVNDAVIEMLSIAERDLQEALPSFRVNEVLGSNMDDFHKSPSHQRNLLDSLTSTYRSEVAIGSRIFVLIANPVVDDNDVRLGTVIEWNDVTEERNAEDEIAVAVNAIGAGDFTSRIDETGKKGFMLNIAEGINAISTICEKGLTEVVDMLRSLSDGDLTSRIETEYQGTFNDLKQDSNTTAERLTEIVTSIASAADEVASASSQISDGTLDLSERTEAQASALEETAAAMEEMAATVKTNSENAQEANQLSQEASDVATKGSEVVESAVIAMSAIEDSSQKISDIIGVIDEIAFQTNLLALNAAVEAARAGDAGRGFAVVASEVRTLAQRSSEAAKDIKTLIVDSGNQVKDGVRLVGETGESLEVILKSIKNVTDIVSDIAAASEEQSTGIEEINTSVTEMDDMTQQNSALVEENAAAAKSMEEQANTMNDEMTFFNVNGASSAQKSIASPTKKKAAKKTAPKKIAATKQAAKKKAPVADDDDWSDF
tara:strand:+ start:2614 stop:5334 length:2721 start_codon:yes stop_codon:yes gene_type:complete